MLRSPRVGPAEPPVYGDRVLIGSSASSYIIDAVGVHVRLDLSGLTDEERGDVERAWADARILVPPASGVTAPEATVVPSASDRAGQTLSDLSSAVTQAAIQARRGDLWLLHAAGLAAPDGGVVALVGASGAGKTTATSVLATRLGYVSDETVGIEEDGRVRPYRKPLSVITAGRSFKVQHRPTDLGLRTLPDAPLHIRRLVVLDRAAEPTRARLVPLTPGEALVALAPQSSALTSMPRPLRTLTSLISRTGGVVRAEYAESRDLIELLDAVVNGELPRATVDPFDAIAEPPRSPSSRVDGALMEPRYHRAATVDWCALPDGQLAVLSEEPGGRGTLRVLAGAAPSVWAAADGATRDELLREVVGADTTPDAVHALDGVLRELTSAGVLRLVHQ